MHTLTPTKWHETPAAQRALRALDPDQVSTFEPASAWNGLGIVELEFSGKTDEQCALIEKLDKLRRQYVDRAYGTSFSELSAMSQINDYLQFDESHDSVTSAIKAHFAARQGAAA